MGTQAKKLAGMVDELGALRAEMEPLKVREKHLAEAVRSAMRAAELDEAFGERFRAALIADERMEIDPADLRAMVTAEEFLSLVRADVAACRKSLAAVDLAKVATTTTAWRLRIDRKE